MFRIFGFAWNPATKSQATAAHRLAETIQRAPGWQAVLAKPGLRVYTLGHRQGIDGFHPLPRDRGVILGRLFRRCGEPIRGADISLAPEEGDRILETGGRALVEDHWGRYIAILESRQGGASVLRDPGGGLPCYLGSVADVTVFFSWLEDFLAFAPDAPLPRIDWKAIAALMSLGHLGGGGTALEGISQVLPGRLTPLREHASPPTVLWSAVAIARTPVQREPEVAAAQLRQAVMDCVHAWSSCHEAVVLRLSGGLDSAILLGALCARSTATRIVCLNYHSPGADSDERGFARLAARKAGVELVERERDATYRLDAILDVSRMPTPVNHVGCMDTTRIDAEVADANGARAMFTGGGGDQLFFQHRCTWPAADHLRTHGLGRDFLRASLDAARLGRVSLWECMRRALADRRRRTSPMDGFGDFFHLARREPLEDIGDLGHYQHPDLPSAANLPIGKFHHVRDLIDPVDCYDPYLRDAAPELVEPFFSQPLVELCLGLPTWLLSHGGRSRALARQAFARDLPREIARRQSKGGMEDHVAAVLRRSLPLARELLLDGHLVREGLLDRDRTEAALAGRLSGLDTYQGEIHHYLSIEAWLRGFAPAR